MDAFPKAVNKYFEFLKEYGFSVAEKEEFNTTATGNGYYVLMSNKVGLEIILDRGQILMSIGKISHARRDWLEWSIVISAYAPDIKAYDLNANTDTQVKKLSKLLQQYCSEMLTGNFSNQGLHAQIENKLGRNFLDRFLQSYPW